ncbi:thylakoid lumenal 19 kDa protein, chloroplastic-like [Chenopodium quinoa]|uniref:thylakoid lumenal 19 kDa protein, chloroplastic-like n=1 Tax=Chenopodium quinoa TaxID=63459 RepID=UPI000B7851D8|nr:thylakoid lumenal 19 kDa protein, chloroplastic-like [Chenopodium quinoa]
MATIFSGSALVSTSTSTLTKPPQTPTKATPITCLTKAAPQTNNKLTTTLTAIATAAVVLSSSPPTLADSTTAYSIYYGTAASAANYGGYGGNSSKKDSAEYTYEVPQGWKERLVSKVEKGTNGTDSEFYNPKKKTEREYLTFLSGFRQLDPIPKDVVLNNLALSDVLLLDQISNAESLTSQDRRDENGQLYYDYEIDGAATHSLISVTCANNKLYAHFVNAPSPEWNRDQEMLRHLHQSFKTLL